MMEFRRVMERDIAVMAAVASDKKPEGRKRDPSIAWILDFNNDGIISVSVGYHSYLKLNKLMFPLLL